MFGEMLNTIGESLSEVASSHDEEDGEDEDDDEEDPAWGKLSEVDEPGCVMGTIFWTVEYRIEPFRQKQMQFVELRQPDWGDVADSFCERDTMYGTT